MGYYTNYFRDAALNVMRGTSFTGFTAYTGLLLWETANQKAFTANATTNQLTITAHGYSANQVLILDSDNAGSPGTLPGGLARATPYYVIVVDANTIQLSATYSGTAIDITDTGTGTHYVHPGVSRAGTGMTEASAGGYARQLTAYGVPAANGDSREIASSAEEAWTASGAAIGKVAAKGTWDAATLGNLISVDYVTPEQVNSGNTYRFQLGNIIERMT